jgi:8-oxo-dGTP diphosphatase
MPTEVRVMDIFLVDQITEPDFGCEECARKEPMALLRLSKISADQEDKRYIEVSEQRLSDEGISEGKKVCFTENGDLKKYVSVVAAVISKTENGIEKIFATQRGYGDYKDGWEFPGGKVEPGESPEAAIVREIKEELDTDITVDKYIGTVEYDYPKFYLYMRCYRCSIESGSLVLKEHEAAKWLSMDEIDSVNWLPADIEVVKMLRNISSATL